MMKNRNCSGRHKRGKGTEKQKQQRQKKKEQDPFDRDVRNAGKK
jgi:hypothetical protein